MIGPIESSLFISLFQSSLLRSDALYARSVPDALVSCGLPVISHRIPVPSRSPAAESVIPMREYRIGSEAIDTGEGFKPWEVTA
jgi:hypothetical protein